MCHLSGQIEKGAHYNKKILDLLDEESISGEAVVKYDSIFKCNSGSSFRFDLNVYNF